MSEQKGWGFKLSHYIDRANSRVGRFIALLLLPLTFIAMYEVTARYLFSRPTIWAWDINVQLLVIVIVLGGSFTMLEKEHVRLELLTSRFSDKVNAILELALSPILFFILGVMIWYSGAEALSALRDNEIISATCRVTVFPTKMIVFIGCFLFLLQILSGCIRNVIKLRSRANQ
jgi:TRAP-type mannitol/chloroaromatic compound transport system permease small subunit